MWELLKLTARAVESQTYEWLLSWLNHTLAHFYQYHTRKLEKAVMIWVDLLASASHQMGSADEFMSHGYHFNLAAVLFEGSGEVLNQPYHVREGSKACGTDRYTSDRHSCFWLYFGHHRSRNYDTALHWLRESKRLKEEHIRLCSHVDCPVTTCSDADYFCCNYDYLRCEADLLMKLDQQIMLVQSQVGLEHHLHQLPIFIWRFVGTGTGEILFYYITNWKLPFLNLSGVERSWRPEGECKAQKLSK